MVEVEVRHMYRDDAGTWVTEASDLECPAGRWPTALLVVDAEGGPYLLPFKEKLHDSQVWVYQSRSENPLTIHVLND